VLVRRLVELGVVVGMTGYARNRHFSYEPYVRLFADDVLEEGVVA
jgi:hypothetical protein